VQAKPDKRHAPDCESASLLIVNPAMTTLRARGG